MSKKSDRKRLELEKIEGQRITERMSDALEGRGHDAAWNEQYVTPTKKAKKASKKYPGPKKR